MFRVNIPQTFFDQKMSDFYMKVKNATEDEGDRLRCLSRLEVCNGEDWREHFLANVLKCFVTDETANSSRNVPEEIYCNVMKATFGPIEAKILMWNNNEPKID